MRFVVRGVVFPATIQNADPFEGQGAHGGVMAFAFGALVLVVGTRPLGEADGVRRPLVKGLSLELGTGPAEVNPLALPAAFEYGSDAAVALDLDRTLIPFPPRPQGRQQTRTQGRSGPRQREVEGRVWVLAEQLVELALQVSDPLAQRGDLLDQNLHQADAGLDDRR